MNTNHFEVVVSEWPNEYGDSYWTITDGREEKGEFETRAEAEENMMRIISNWRRDS